MKINIMGYSCCVPLHIYFIKTKPSRNVSSRSPKCCSCLPPSLDQDSFSSPVRMHRGSYCTNPSFGVGGSGGVCDRTVMEK